MSVMRWPIRRLAVPSIGTRHILGTVALVAGILTIASCGGGDTSALQTEVAGLQTKVGENSVFDATTTAGPDRIVGTEYECRAGNTPNSAEVWGDVCKAFGTALPGVPDGSIAVITAGTPTTIVNRRQVLTVRTSLGRTYTVAVALTQTVKLGDPWPPP